MGLDLQCFTLESCKFVLGAVGRKNKPSRDGDCGGEKGVLCPGQGLVHRNLLQDIKNLYFRT